MPEIELRITDDGPRHRWELWLVGSDIPSARFIAKGSRWWNSEQEARDDADVFLDALPNAKIRRPDGL